MESSSKKKVEPYGSWESSVSARSVGSGDHVFELNLEGDDVYLVEVRPREPKARYSIMKVKATGGQASELIGAPFNARSTVHEYGGGGFVIAGDSIVFSNFDDQRLYKRGNKDTILPLTREGSDSRYADGVFDKIRNRIVCVRELHPVSGKREAVNSIVAVDLKTGAESVLATGNDFYSFPRISPDGSLLAWISWNFPNMPFDGSELWVGDLDSSDGSIANKRKLAGGLDESVTQPKWKSTRDLYFISDRTGWWNIYRWNESEGISSVCPKDADFCHPDWNLGLSTYAFGSDGEILCTFAEEGEWKLARIRDSRLEIVESQFTEVNHIQSSGAIAVFLAGSPTEGHAVFQYNFPAGKIQKIYESPEENSAGPKIPPSLPNSLTFPTSNNSGAYGFFYTPLNPEYRGPEGDLPPLIVMVHGGPTHASSNVLRGNIQFFTSRGFAVFDVNYGGSSAYGREFRRRLNGQWGVVEVEDAVNGAKYLGKEGRIDEKRVVIRGGSAGGWATLAALAFTDFFRAGACYYGISDLERWELDCHKFESQYLHSLIGSYPQERELFSARSPTRHAKEFRAPLIIFQGLEDKVVPPSQSELMVAALKKEGKSVEYFPFAGEQHDFRQAAHIEEALTRELELYRKVLKIPA